jgi:aminopeptidase N
MQRIPVTMTGDTTVIDELTGKGDPALVFANSRDLAYALVLLDLASVTWVEREIGNVRDGFLRSMLWGAMWDLVREGMLSPDRFVRLAVSNLPREGDEQIVAGIIGRLTRATTAYLSDTQRAAILPSVESALLDGANDGERTYGVRKAHLDAWIRVAATNGAIGRLDATLDSAHAAGEPLRPPTRWAIVTRLVALGAPRANERLASEIARDRTPEGARRAFVAQAATPDSQAKRELFTRYFSDATLNEDWVTASLEGFNELDAQSLSRPYLAPALDSLRWIQKNRRIFFLGGWISSFVEGQTSEDALNTVRQFLTDHPDLPSDLRSKILQSSDELERTVRIRKLFSTGDRVSSVKRPPSTSAGTPRSFPAEY